MPKFFPQRRSTDNFDSNCTGNVTIIFGLSAVSLMLMVGGAIDVGRVYSVKSKVQSVLDSAALAGGRAVQLSASHDPNAGIVAATTYFQEMRPQTIGGAAADFALVENSTVLKGTISLAVATPFLKLVGFPQMLWTLTAEAAIASGGEGGSNLEISLMLDTTGSMGGQKIEDLKAAAKDLVDIVIWNDQSMATSRVALAPFAARVNVGTYMAQVTGMKSTWSGRSLRPCATERTGVEAFTDTAPGTSAWLNANDGTRNSNTSNYSFSGNCSPSEQIVPLTTNKTLLKERIDAFTADGSTAGALGTAWAWYLLSPKWNSIWPTESKAGSYGDLTVLGPKGAPKLQKIAVLMTDGIYNTTGGANYGDTSSQATTISGNAEALCTAMKAAGIRVYTVGFQLGGSQLAIDTLRNCASTAPEDPQGTSSYFFNAASGDELKAAFRQIALQLTTLRLRS